MKNQITKIVMVITIVFAMVCSFMSAPAYAFVSSDLDILNSTGNCPNCDLQAADLLKKTCQEPNYTELICQEPNYMGLTSQGLVYQELTYQELV